MEKKEQIPTYDELVAIVRAIVPRCICEKPARYKVLYRKAWRSGQDVTAQSSLPVCSKECFDDVRIQLHKGTLKTTFGTWDGKPVELMALNELTIRLSCLVECIEKNAYDDGVDQSLDASSIRFSLLELD